MANGAMTRPTRRRQRVLVLDSDAARREALAARLRFGDEDEVVEAADAVMAVEMCATGDVDVVLADLANQLEESDVLLRNLAAQGGPPVIDLSESGDVRRSPGWGDSVWGRVSRYEPPAVIIGRCRAASDAGERRVVELRMSVVSMPGEVDESNADEVSMRLQAPAGADVVVDMTENRFIGSAGLRVLVLARRQLIDGGGTLSVSNVPPHAVRVFEATGLLEVLCGSRSVRQTGA